MDGNKQAEYEKYIKEFQEKEDVESLKVVAEDAEVHGFKDFQRRAEGAISAIENAAEGATEVPEYQRNEVNALGGSVEGLEGQLAEVSAEGDSILEEAKEKMGVISKKVNLAAESTQENQGGSENSLIEEYKNLQDAVSDILDKDEDFLRGAPQDYFENIITVIRDADVEDPSGDILRNMRAMEEVANDPGFKRGPVMQYLVQDVVKKLETLKLLEGAKEDPSKEGLLKRTFEKTGADLFENDFNNIDSAIEAWYAADETLAGGPERNKAFKELLDSLGRYKSVEEISSLVKELKDYETVTVDYPDDIAAKLKEARESLEKYES